MTRRTDARPALSVIIPVFNSAGFLEVCLRALRQSKQQPVDVIVVDDGSTDGSSEVAFRSGARVVRFERNGGPAAARNAGARVASGDVLVFLDADTEVHEDTLELISSKFELHPSIDAVFGSYDDSPSDPGRVSSFRNLLHAYVHREAPREANTFWAGCGAIRKQVFDQVGGFDEHYSRASTEDVELGMRLAKLGMRIEVDPAIQVKHLKRWTLRSMIRTDLLQRAIPFGELIVREKRYPRVLGLRQLASALMVALLVPWLADVSMLGVVAVLLAYLALNWKFLRFLRDRIDPGFAVQGLILLVVHHVCGALGVTVGAARYIRRRVAASPASIALVAMLAVTGWQSLTVWVNYRGNWTALFCTSEYLNLPDEVAQSTYRFQNSTGYDGQFYRLVAHDPFLVRGYSEHADSAAARWRRILVPAAAWALAAGEAERVDFAYLLVVLLCSGLGVYALGRWLSVQGRSPAGGLVFLVFPGTMICLDRMTVDIALYALLFLCLLWDEEGKHVRVWLGLALCGLVRDLGFLVLGGFILAELAARHWRKAAWMMSAALPGAAWYLFLRDALTATSSKSVAPEVARWAFRDIGYGIFLRMSDPIQYNLLTGKAVLTMILDEVALLGMVVGVVMMLLRFRWIKAEKLEWIGFVFAALFFAASAEGFWRDVFSWPRAFTPMFAALLFTGERIPRWLWLPMAAVSLRVALQFGTQIEGILLALR